MRWIKVTGHRIFRLIHNGKQIAVICGFGYGWYGKTHHKTYGNHQSLRLLKDRIIDDLFPCENKTLH